MNNRAVAAIGAVNAFNPEHLHTSNFFGGLYATADILNHVWSIIWQFHVQVFWFGTKLVYEGKGVKGR